MRASSRQKLRRQPTEKFISSFVFSYYILGFAIKTTKFEVSAKNIDRFRWLLHRYKYLYK